MLVVLSSSDDIPSPKFRALALAASLSVDDQYFTFANCVEPATLSI